MRRLITVSSLALVSVHVAASNDVGLQAALPLESTRLRPVTDGVALNEEQAAGALWQDRGAVILVARRPG